MHYQTPENWAEAALKNFNAFLLDHAACERKASAVGMSFVVRYPDRAQLLDPMIQFAREELEHFHQVVRLTTSRGLILPPDEPDPYVNSLMKEVRFGREERFLDRLLVSSVIEARGTERMFLVADYFKHRDPEMERFYTRLARAEDRHKDFFIGIAMLYFDKDAIETRYEELLKKEDKLLETLPWRCALH